MRSLVKKKMSASKVRIQNAPNATVQSVNLDEDLQGCSRQNRVPKKKVRRRLHTSKPYQERLLNMAEARKEIVTALRFHRASMKQQEQQLQEQEQPPPHAYDAKLADMSLRNIHMIYPSDGCSNHVDSFGFGFALPSQALGLNLNFQDFSNSSNSHYHFQTDPCLFASPSSSSTSSAALSTEEIHSAAEAGCPEMERMKSLENWVWNDTRKLETCREEFDISEDEILFKELTEIPSWLNPKDLYITCPEDSSPDPSLPWMDIGEIECMDGDWLA